MAFWRKDSVEKQSSRGEEILAEALGACARHFQGARVFSGLIAFLYLAPTIYMLQIYDRIMPTEGLMTLLFMTVALGFALLVHSFLERARQRLLSRGVLRLDKLLGPRLVRQGFEERRGASMRSMQITREFDTYRTSLQGPGAVAKMDLPYAGLFVIVAFMLHPWIGSLILAGACVMILIAVMGGRAERKATENAAEKTARSYASTELPQMYGGAVRALGMGPAMTQRIIGDRLQLSEQNVRNMFVASRYSSWIRLLRMGLQSAALGLGAYLAITQGLSPGSLIAASVLAGRCLAPIEQMVSSWRLLGQGASAREEIIRFLDETPEDRPRTPLPAPRGELMVESITARAGQEERFALRSVSFGLRAGEALGVIGMSGAGKSTLARILVGAQAPDQGVVRLDGSNLVDWDSDALGPYLGYLPQDPVLFAGTVGENICRFQEGQQKAAVEASIAAGAHAMIQRLPQGYDTVLGPGGGGLSAGQAQRVALARALYRDPSLMVLDEPNAHLDTDGEAALLATLQAARSRGATVVVMTHRSGVLTAVDKLLVLKEGRVDKFGPKAEVLAALRKSAVKAGSLRVLGTGGKA